VAEPEHPRKQRQPEALIALTRRNVPGYGREPCRQSYEWRTQEKPRAEGSYRLSAKEFDRRARTHLRIRKIIGISFIESSKVRYL